MRRTIAGRAVLEVADLAYEAATDDSRWPAFLAGAAELVGADNAYVSHIRIDRLQLDYVVLDEDRWEPEALRRYREMMPCDAFMRALRAAPTRPIHCAACVPRPMRERSPIYREIFPRLDIGYSLGVKLASDADVDSYLGLTRGNGKRPFADDHVERVGAVVPHLRRALHTRRDQDAMRLRAALGAQVADRLPLAVLVVQRDGRLVSANATARAMLDDGDPVGLRAGRVTCDEALRSTLHGAIRRVTDPATPGPGRSETIVLPTEARTVVAVIGSFAHSEPVDGAVPPLAVIVMQDLAGAFEADLDSALRELYGLPPSLARLAGLLADGLTLREAARRLGITEASARIYLKRLFERTDTARQADLVRHLARLAVMLPATPGRPS